MKRMKYILIYTFFLMSVFHTSCRQSQKNGSNEKTHTKYEYTDSIGKSLTIQNSFPKGDSYTDPNGKRYFKVIFWTRIINQTDNPLELKIDFPVDPYELPSSPGRYFKILLPSDTMTIDKEPLYNYGLTGLKSFLDNSIHKPSSLKRTINPKESSGFYVVILFDNGIGGPVRTGLSIKGQNLFYSVSGYDSTPARSLIYEKEINCGSINLKNLMLKK
jgi:hypothetical protein